MIKRIVIFSFDLPYPPNRGGRSDIWRRLLAFRQLGIEVVLVAWYSPGNGTPPTAAEIDVVRTFVSQLHLFSTQTGPYEWLQRLRRLPKLPSHVSSRRLARPQWATLESSLRNFDPDVLWCEGPYPGELTRLVSAALKRPYVYRSHNVEHLYMARQAQAARRWKDRLAWKLACIGLEAFEIRMIRQADWVFDISCDDIEVWRGKGIERISWLPPIAQSAVESEPCGGGPDQVTAVHDVVFLGNLTTPNNVRGVEWLVQEIAPLVEKLRPGTRFLVAGSNPGSHVKAVCSQQPHVTLLENPADAAQVYRSGTVLVNPVQTGSGLHVKMIEMLMADAPIVTAEQGTQGFPAEGRSLFLVASNAEQFAAHIFAALNKPSVDMVARRAARQWFNVAGLADSLTLLSSSPAACEDR